MKFHDTSAADGHRLSSYGAGYFVVDDRRIHSSIVLSPAALVEDWGPRTVDELDAPAIEVIESLEPEIVVLGTGATQRFPDPALLAPLHRRRVGVEVMSTDAACRTYAVLASESRLVAAALIVIEASPPR